MSIRGPANGPPWLPDFIRSIEQTLREVLSYPLRLWRVATADLPTASNENKGGLVWDETAGLLKWSDGSAWVGPALSSHTHTEADINLSATDRLVGRDTAGAGAAEELTVGGGIEFTGSGGIQRSALTGDVTASAGSNATTIANNAVSDAKLRDSAALSVIGRSANSTGDPADIAAGSDGQVLRRSGTSLGFGTVATAGIADDAVTYAKMQNVSATQKLLGRSTAGSGDVEEIDVGAWDSYTPTVSASSGTITTVSATGRYKKVGRLVFFEAEVVITTNGTGAGVLLVSLPFASARDNVVIGREYAVTGNLVTGTVAASGTNLNVVTYTNAYPGGSGYQIKVGGSYQSTT